MVDGNNTLSPVVKTAHERIRTLQAVTRKTGLQTQQEQFKVLMELGNDDALSLAELMSKDRKVEGR
jgi:hypothetical protein